MTKIVKDDLQKTNPKSVYYFMYICLKSRHVTQSSVCTAKPFTVFLRIYIFTYFHSFLCFAIYSISIDFICIIMSTNTCHGFVTAPLPVLISLEIVASCPTETILIVVLFFPNSQQYKKHSLESQVSAVFWFLSASYLMILLVFSPAPVDSHESLIQADALMWRQRE